MAYYGLFIGIDRYQSQAINWLSCAVRDAKALHGLFADTLGPGGVLLSDSDATKSNIEAEFQHLYNCDLDDVVVITFSGHGSDTHELITCDADIANLSGTVISLEMLIEWFKQIPARRLVCILDCCFSGGMGAKVFHMDAAPRGLLSADNLLDQMSGDGRLIFTASKATEPAWENRRHGHGYLTYYLLQALQGAEEIREGGKISVYRLLEYVTQRVIAAAAQHGQPQHPTLRGQIDGQLTWPIFIPGSTYLAAFPELAPALVSSDVQSLGTCGIPDHLLQVWKQAVPTLNQLQIDAINEYGVLRGDHLVVSAPTSSGKTMIGELAALKGAADRRRAAFLLPLKALVNDKHRHFTAIYGPAGIRVLRATGDYSADMGDLLRGRYDICLITYEKFANVVLANPHVLRQIGTIVVDEVQMIADENRGTTVEFILTLLRAQRIRGIEPQVIALSAVIGDTNGLERWLNARLLLRTQRPVPLDEGVVLPNGTFKYIDASGREQQQSGYIRPQWGDGKHRDWVIPLVHKLVQEGKQVIVFRETKGEARHCAKYLSEFLGLPAANSVISSLPSGDTSNASEALREVLSHGVGFHVSDLNPDERIAVETGFRIPSSGLRVIAATTTLAMGVNTPASAVIIVGLEHPGPKPYSVAEYKNIVDRAGRLGHSEHGTSYLLAINAHEVHHLWNHYVLGKPEHLQSHFFAEDSDPRSLILRVLVAARISSVDGMPAEDIVEFLDGSFSAYRLRQSASGWQYDRQTLMDALLEMTTHGLVEQTSAGGFHLTELGRIGGESGILVQSIIWLVEMLRPLPNGQLSTATLITATQCTVELDDIFFPINKKSTQREPFAWKTELRGQNVADSVMNFLHHAIQDQFDSTLRAKKAVACLLWMSDRPLLDIETSLMRFGGGFGGVAGAIQAVTSRTYDILPTVARIAEILHPGSNLTDRVHRLMVRLEIGLPSSVVEIAIQAGLSLSRSDYLQLAQKRLGTFTALANATDGQILECVAKDGKKLAIIREAEFTHLHADKQAKLIQPLLPPPVD